MLTEESQMVTCWPSGAGRDSSIESRFFARGNRWRAASATSWPAKCCAARPSTVDARPRTSTHPGQTSGTSSVSDSLGATKPFVPRIVFFSVPGNGLWHRIAGSYHFREKLRPLHATLRDPQSHTRNLHYKKSSVYRTSYRTAFGTKGFRKFQSTRVTWSLGILVFPGFEYRVLQFQNVEASLPQVACLTKPTHREGPV